MSEMIESLTYLRLQWHMPWTTHSKVFQAYLNNFGVRRNLGLQQLSNYMRFSYDLHESK